MKKIGLVLVSLFAMTLAGCGDPSKSDVCGDCDDVSKQGCEAGYDLCKDTDSCDLGDYQDAIDKSGTCG